MKVNKYLYIQSFGCQMNVHDAQRMEEVLNAQGFLKTMDPQTADIILVNTCSVREKSHAKVLSALGRFGELKKKRPQMLLAVAGCVAQQEGARLLELAPMVDLVFGPDHIAELPRLVQQASERQQVQTGFADPRSYRFLRAAPDSRPPGCSAFVTIQKGCDNQCAYCIVPSVRGPAVCRPAHEILAEIDDLIGAGVKEVTLIGQNVNAYRGLRGSCDDFVELLRAVNDLAGDLRRIRFTTSHPKDLHPDMPACFGDLERLCPWLHLPVQSGSTRVLGLMNRGYTREEYLERLARIRQRCPQISLGTDIIVGFPGETERDFLDTISLLEEIQYDYIYSFMFSARPNTPAAGMKDELSEAEKLGRLHHLQEIQEQITMSRLSRWVGNAVEVLVEGPSRQGLPQLCGRTPGNQVVNIDCANPDQLLGRIVDIRITEQGKHSLMGEVLRGDPV